MKREFPLILVFLAGAFMIVQYFVPAEISERAYEFLLDWTIIIGIFALALGIWSLVRVSIHKIRNRHPDAKYAIVTIAGLAAMIFFGFQLPGVEYKSDRDVAKVNHFIRGQLGVVKSQSGVLVNTYPSDRAQTDSIYGMMIAAADSAQHWISHLQHSKWVIRSQSDTVALEQLQVAVGSLKQELAHFDPTGADSALWAASLSDIQTFSDSALALSAAVSNIKDDYPFIGGLASYMFRAFFDHVMIPIQSTMFSLLAFYMLPQRIAHSERGICSLRCSSLLPLF